MINDIDAIRENQNFKVSIMSTNRRNMATKSTPKSCECMPYRSLKVSVGRQVTCRAQRYWFSIWNCSKDCDVNYFHFEFLSIDVANG